MSTLTRCNSCNLKDIQRRAAKRGAEVSVRQCLANEEMAGWIEVKVSDEDKPCAWFLSLTFECAC